MAGEVTAAAGWFQDPGGTPVLRYWDGAAWTPYISVPFDAVSPTAAIARERALTMWVRRAWLVWPIVVLGAAFAAIVAMDGLFDHLFSERGHRPWRFWALQPVGYLLLAFTVVIVIWAYRSAVAGRALGIHARREPGLVVVGWFVPVINLWWPYESVADLVPDRTEVQPTLAIWWAAYLGQGLVVLVLEAISVIWSWQTASIGLVLLAAVAVTGAVSGRRIARDVLATHEREIAARWLEREV